MRFHSPRVGLALLLTLLLGGSSMSAEPNSEDTKLATLFQTYLKAEFERHPYYATQLGNHDYDDQLDDLSPKARATDLAIAEKWLNDLPKQIDAKKLSRPSQIDLEIWMHSLRYQIWQTRNDNRFEYDPRVYGEYLSDSVFTLFSQSTLPKPRIVGNASKRILQLPKVIAAAKASLQHPPRILTEVAIRRTKSAISFYEKEIFELSGETPATSELTTPCREAVRELQDYLKYLETELLPKSTGEWRIGLEKFSRKLEMELDSGLTATDVIREAEAEADRVEREMYFVSKQLWHKLFPGQAVPADLPAGRRLTVKKVLDKLGENHSKPNEFIVDARKSVDQIRKFIREKKILTLPDPDRCEIIEMPEFQRGFSTAYLNPAPPLDPKANSLYAVSPPPSDWPLSRQIALLQEYNRSMLQILSIHEAYPGHYVQLEYANRHPSQIRKILWSGVFAEGWAVYTEQMMLDQGYGDGDLALRLHQLKFYIRAVLNAILDHRMHCSNLSDEDGLKMLMESGFQTEGEAVGKIQRAKQSSCQLSTYFVGRTAFYRLRQNVQQARGDSFNLGKYHEEVLSHGTLPVKYLPELVK